MKVILLQDVKALGKKGDLVDVSDGYARNMLLKKKLGVEATNKNINDLKLQKAHQDKVAAEELQAAKDLAEEISRKSISMQMKVGKNGKAFGTISTKEMAAAVKDQLGYDLDKKKFSVDVPIKALGTYTAKIKLHPQVTAQLKVNVTEQKK